MRDATVDVLVVGGGLGGLAAATIAARRGAEVAVVEATDRIGGNAAVSTGYIAFASFSRQLNEGHVDSPDAFLDDMRAEYERESTRYGLYFDEVVAGIYARRSAEAYDFLAGLGVKFGHFVARPLQHTRTRLMALEDTSEFCARFESELDRLGVRVVYHARADRLVVEDDRVVGARVSDASGTTTWHARGAVVLATGGFQANPEMRRLFQPAALADAPYYGVTTARGDGHVLGQAVGGQLINMTYIPMFVRAPSALVEDVIAVNLSGRRFHNEPGPYLERVAALESQPEGWGFYILDSVTAREKARMLAHVPGVPAEAPTLAELASIIGVSGDSLRTTVEEWNEQLARGDSDPFGRTVFPRERRGIVAPPFYAVKMVVGASFTAGGFRVSPRMDVLDFEGQPIEGLLAVGDCVGSVNAANGLGGVHLGAAATLGMVAGERAVELVEP